MKAEEAEGQYLLGVLGGMGPAATADFYTKLIKATKADRDQEHVPVIIWGDPRTPDRTEAILNNGDDPTDWLIRGARALRGAGATEIVVPCNTAHHFVRNVAKVLDLNLIDMVEETSTFVAQSKPPARVGILASTGTIRSGLYQDSLYARGIATQVPEESVQRRLMQGIGSIKAGNFAEGRKHMVSALEHLREAGAMTVIAGCTEIPLGLEGVREAAHLVDPVNVVISGIVSTFLESRRAHA